MGTDDFEYGDQPADGDAGFDASFDPGGADFDVDHSAGFGDELFGDELDQLDELEEDPRRERMLELQALLADELRRGGETDRALEIRLAMSDPRQRVGLLRAAGRTAEALDDAQLLISPPAVAIDSWRVLMLSADDLVRSHDWDNAARLQEHAWGYADARDRQGTTMQHAGKRLSHSGDQDGAAAFCEVGRALRHGFADPALVESSELTLAGIRARSGYDAIVLAGGQGRRLGGGKAERHLGGWPLLDHVLVAASSAKRRIVVGPARRGLGQPIFVQESPAGTGPLAGLAAAVDQLSQPLVAVLAADLPFIRPALDQFRTVLSDGSGRDAVALVDISGRLNYLAAMWRTDSLRAALSRLGDPAGRPVRELYESIDVLSLADFDSVGSDVDTPNDLQAAEDRLFQSPPTRFADPADPRLARLPATPLAWPGLELHAPS